MKLIVLLTCLFSISAWANTPAVTTAETNTIVAEEPSGWRVEGGVMFDSLAATSSPMVSAAIGKDVTENNTLMFNSAMPIVMNNDDEGVNLYKASAIWRYHFVNRSSRLYSETVANMYFVDADYSDTTNFLTFGWALGVTYKLNSELSMGGSAGFDFSRHEVTEDNVTLREESLFVHPKLAVNAAFHF